jgi:hypothetical protein
LLTTHSADDQVEAVLIVHESRYGPNVGPTTKTVSPFAGPMLVTFRLRG